jgi:hypothetical protein
MEFDHNVTHVYSTIDSTHGCTRWRWFRLPWPALALAATTACFPHHTFLRDQLVRTEPEADFRQPISRVELAYGTGYYLANSWRAPAAAYGRSRPYVLVDVGNPTPIVAWSNKPIEDPNRRPFVPYAAKSKDSVLVGTDWSGQWTVQLTVPVAFYLFWDAFTNNNPIVDTDYTFGFDLSGRTSLHELTEQRFGVYWGHISTHLGDEYVISGRQSSQPFPRVNVSMFPWRINGSNRWYSTRAAQNGARSYVQVGAQVEGPCVVCHDSAYYYTYPTETDGVTIPSIRPGLEPTVTADWRWYTSILPHTANATVASLLEPSSFNVGLLIGNRRIFPYVPTTTANYGAAVNGTFGYRFPAAIASGVSYVELYVRGYHGPNPYGQLRNQSNFSLVAVGAKILH